MDINSKLKEFSESIEESANKEYKQMEQNLENEISAEIEQEVLEYENKKRLSYDKTAKKIEKEYNKKVFNYEIQCKKEIIAEEKRFKKGIKDEAIKILKNYNLNPNYKEFLDKCIKERNFSY